MNEEAMMRLKAALVHLGDAICQMDAGIDMDTAKRIYDQLNNLVYPDNDEEDGE
jgi:hypothetical protein